MVSDAKVRRFQHCVAGKKRLVGCIPKVVPIGNPRQILSAASTANKDQYEQKLKYRAPSHEPNLGLERQASPDHVGIRGHFPDRNRERDTNESLFCENDSLARIQQ